VILNRIHDELLVRLGPGQPDGHALVEGVDSYMLAQEFQPARTVHQDDICLNADLSLRFSPRP